MPSFRTGSVLSVISERAGLQRVQVRFEENEKPQRAYNLTKLTGKVHVGDRVVCNTTAVELGLGTGGWHVVHWNLVNDSLSLPGSGHIMKLRYSSLQTDVGSYHEHHPNTPDSLDSIPVIICPLHSQMGVVAAAFARQCPGARLAYVMTDGAALPIALSDLVADLESRQLLCGTVTAGDAFGGAYEAVNVLSALTTARHALRSDAIVVSMGPGVVGTGTELGHTGLEVADVVHAAHALGGQPVLCLRVSDADQRARHVGLSHHSATALRLIGSGSPFAIGIPKDHRLEANIRSLVPGQGRVVSVALPDVNGLLAELDLTITTMGRKSTDDASFFQFAAAAGVLGASMVGS